MLGCFFFLFFEDDITSNKSCATGALLGNFMPLSHGCVVSAVAASKDS